MKTILFAWLKCFINLWDGFHTGETINVVLLTAGRLVLTPSLPRVGDCSIILSFSFMRILLLLQNPHCGLCNNPTHPSFTPMPLLHYHSVNTWHTPDPKLFADAPEEEKTGRLVIATSQAAGSLYSLCSIKPSRVEQSWATQQVWRQRSALSNWPCDLPFTGQTRRSHPCSLRSSLCCVQLIWCRWMRPAGESTGRWRQRCPACSESPDAPPSPRLRDMPFSVTASGVSGDLWRGSKRETPGWAWGRAQDKE